ncbi:MAG: YggS family pyridoxal phosphate-dependent enzyme [Candidatus Kapabacteria bacterium]|nr:YggS family pyridoxal phosphate-dependent enzyme [Candidatus Kapabacteria bacterium]
MTEISSKEILSNYNLIKESVGEAKNVKIIAVSKTHSFKIIQNAFDCGIRIFGENYAQEFRDKIVNFQNKKYNDIEWHFIGHLQSNKVKYLAPYVTYIHSVDSIKLAEEISKQAIKNNRIIKILVQVNTSGEISKSGCQKEDLNDILKSIKDFQNIEVVGLMTIAGLEGTEEKTKEEFGLLKLLLEKTNKELKLNLTELSMGMTGDFEMAIKEGATMIRIGTAIFGNRNYNLG